MKKIFVSQLSPGEVITESFLLYNIKKKTKKDGGIYYELTLSDKEGEISGVIFDEIEKNEPILKEGIFLIKGRVVEYNENLQVKIMELTPLKEYDLFDFIPSSPYPLEKMVKRLYEEIGSIENPYIKSLLKNIFDDSEFMEKFKITPAAKRYHHNYIGGLIEHSLRIASILRALHNIYPETNLDLLITGALLHDIGKVEAYTLLPQIDFSDKGRLLEHIYIGCKMVEEKIYSIKDFPQDLKLKILHIIAAHHGGKEMGALTVPMIDEAVLINFADLIDMTMFKFKKAKASLKSQARWSEYQKDLKRYIFFGDEEK